MFVKRIRWNTNMSQIGSLVWIKRFPYSLDDLHLKLCINMRPPRSFGTAKNKNLNPLDFYLNSYASMVKSHIQTAKSCTCSSYLMVETTIIIIVQVNYQVIFVIVHWMSLVLRTNVWNSYNEWQLIGIKKCQNI